MKVAVIPARGGSKRIPRKNIREFAGKPMIAHSIEVAIQSGVFDRVIVSTDDAEIATVAKCYGAEIPFMRPRALSDDYTGTGEVVAHAITWLRDNHEHPTAVCCIYATAPFVQIEDLRQGLVLLESGNWQHVFSATTFGYPIFRAFEKGPNDGLKMFFPENYNKRSQDLPEAWHDAGQFYWSLPQAALEGRPVFEQWSTIVPIPRWRVQDIDTPEDWERAECIAVYLSAKHTT